ncbi:conserved hypothetical protein [Trichophyton verrucosum HKI 0517]|uniref:BTB domain-containing protein n=1 Tax=Trichophyton verrucosum (strain HKI 0517) TaxID=663202 RepID=D4DJ85_TRIVH|nr:uncharacterized protein TRV_07251 [Trichophyton verrucosum HKI 0517]EFE38101.1 conserved hypothetical protein [Trichophyton verrucosum HKI 0517]
MIEEAFPPLPSPAATAQETDRAGTMFSPLADVPVAAAPPVITIHKGGDLVIICETAPYNSLPEKTRHMFRLSSLEITRASEYFKALLDPAKFQEGRSLLQSYEQMETQYGSRELALKNMKVGELLHIKIELPPLSTKINLRETLALPNGLKEFTVNTISTLASVLVLSDRFLSNDTIRCAFRFVSREHVGPFSYSSIIARLQRCESGDEECIRQGIFSAHFLNELLAFSRLTQSLILQGSVNWMAEKPGGTSGLDKPLWWHLPGGIEEELQFRHDTIIDTISEIQNHFLVAYGAVNPYQALQYSSLFDQPKRQLQCRRALENSEACDSFQLGEMIRYFTSQSKTLFLESGLYSESGIGNREDAHEGSQASHFAREYGKKNPDNSTGKNQAATNAAEMANINTILSYLRCYPERQMDSYHIGCGLRRRLLPLLDYIGKLCIMGKPSKTPRFGQIGLCKNHNLFDNGGPDSWSNNQTREGMSVVASAHSPVSVKYHGINASVAFRKRFKSRPTVLCNCERFTLEARGFFTAKNRRWEC